MNHECEPVWTGHTGPQMVNIEFEKRKCKITIVNIQSDKHDIYHVILNPLETEGVIFDDTFHSIVLNQYRRNTS